MIVVSLRSGPVSGPPRSKTVITSLPCAVEGLLQVGEQLVGIHDAEHGETIVVTRGGRPVALARVSADHGLGGPCRDLGLLCEGY